MVVRESNFNQRAKLLGMVDVYVKLRQIKLVSACSIFEDFLYCTVTYIMCNYKLLNLTNLCKFGWCTIVVGVICTKPTNFYYHLKNNSLKKQTIRRPVVVPPTMSVFLMTAHSSKKTRTGSIAPICIRVAARITHNLLICQKFFQIDPLTSCENINPYFFR